MKFKKKDVIKHLKTGKIYVVVGIPEQGFRLEGSDQPAYLYREKGGEFPVIWIRSQHEVEDGRFQFY